MGARACVYVSLYACISVCIKYSPLVTANDMFCGVRHFVLYLELYAVKCLLIRAEEVALYTQSTSIGPH